VRERSVLPTVLGIPPLAAIALAFVLTAVGLFADLQRIGTAGAVFQTLYSTSCLLAIAWVRRRSLFAPMVQPPLLLTGTVPAVVLIDGGPGPDAGVLDGLLTVGAPLVNSFPMMAVTTAAVLVVGAARLVAQRPRREPVRPGRDSDAARGATRRPATPRRS
jgi:hypothetical protein